MENTDYRNWEKSELKVLIQQIRENERIKDAFKKASELTHRSEAACKKKWYRELKPYGAFLRNTVDIKPVHSNPLSFTDIPVLGAAILQIVKLKNRINETIKKLSSKNQELVQKPKPEA